MPEYKFDALRWCKSMELANSTAFPAIAKQYAQVAEEIKGLRSAVSKLQAEAEILRGMGHELEAVREAVEWWALHSEWVKAHGSYFVSMHKSSSPKDNLDPLLLDALAALVGEEGR